jgi:hypothetical protein
MATRVERLAPLAGLAFVILIGATFGVSGETPSSDDSTAKIVSFWRENDTQQITAAFLGGIAALFLVWFAGSLRRTISRGEGGDGRLASIAFAGAAIAAVGVLLFSGLTYAAADTAGDVPPGVTHTLTVLNNTLFFPLTGGFALLLLASGVAFLRTRVLPQWLGWLSIVIGVLILTPVGFFALLATVLWVGALGIVLYLRDTDDANHDEARPVR